MSTDTSPILEVEGLSKRFGGVVAVDDVTFEIPEGQIVALIGPNGAGKTTTFNLATGFIEPDEGQVRFKGEDVMDEAPWNIVERGMFRTFQNTKPFGDMSVVENVMVAVLRKTANMDQAEARAREVLDFVGLADDSDMKAASLGVPKLKRLELAKGLASDPDLLLLDEIVAGLNPSERKTLVDLIDQIRENGRTVFLIEHVMEVVMALSDNIYVMNKGELIAHGTPEEISTNDRVIKAYLGSEFEQ